MKKKTPSFNPADFEPVRQIAILFPGTADGISHEGTPSVKVGKKLMCRLHESGAFISIRLPFEVRDAYLESHPEVFHLPDHFRKYPYICMWIHPYKTDLLREVLYKSWKSIATQAQIRAYEEKP